MDRHELGQAGSERTRQKLRNRAAMLAVARAQEGA